MRERETGLRFKGPRLYGNEFILNERRVLSFPLPPDAASLTHFQLTIGLLSGGWNIRTWKGNEEKGKRSVYTRYKGGGRREEIEEYGRIRESMEEEDEEKRETGGGGGSRLEKIAHVARYNITLRAHLSPFSALFSYAKPSSPPYCGALWDHELWSSLPHLVYFLAIFSPFFVFFLILLPSPLHPYLILPIGLTGGALLPIPSLSSSPFYFPDFCFR